MSHFTVEVTSTKAALSFVCHSIGPSLRWWALCCYLHIRHEVISMKRRNRTDVSWSLDIASWDSRATLWWRKQSCQLQCKHCMWASVPVPDVPLSIQLSANVFVKVLLLLHPHKSSWLPTSDLHSSGCFGHLRSKPAGGRYLCPFEIRIWCFCPWEPSFSQPHFHSTPPTQRCTVLKGKQGGQGCCLLTKI